MTTFILISVIAVSYSKRETVSLFLFGGKKLTPKEF
jgi:hypothetical protein|nr:MAG TPA: hypothetical protein [Caudoviricetes sp.]